MCEDSFGLRQIAFNRQFMKLINKGFLERMHAVQALILMCMSILEQEHIFVVKKPDFLNHLKESKESQD